MEETLDKLSKRGITLVVSTHDVDFAYRFASRAVVFSRGEIVADAEPDAVFSDASVIREAGLKRPLLFDVARLVRQAFPQVVSGEPRTLEEFRKMLGLDGKPHT